ncbi:MAG TPA: hypothetical protein VGY54_28305 [Polyangiaceae bacterium]|jgi:hypothetical protein|nr:hypothetical protein [Polyangiaceae bacterium]
MARLALKKTPGQAMQPMANLASPAIADAQPPAIANAQSPAIANAQPPAIPEAQSPIPAAAATEILGRSPASLDPAGARLLAAQAFQEGKRHLGANAPERAVTELLRAAALHPGVVEYNLYLEWAEFQSANGEARSAKLESLKQLASQAIQKEPALAFAHYVLGRIATLEGLERTGARFFRKALELDPTLVDAERYVRLLTLRVNTPTAMTPEPVESAKEPPRPGPDLKVPKMGTEPAPARAAVPIEPSREKPASESPQAPEVSEPASQQPALLDSVAPALPKRGFAFPVALAVAGVAVGLAAAMVVVGTSGQRSAAGKRLQSPLASPQPAASTLPTSAASSAEESPPPSAAATPSPPSATASSPVPTAPPVAAVALPTTNADPNMGTVLLPAWTRGRRVYVDSHVVGEGPEPLHLRCGTHVLRLGSAGEEQSVSVPCGGSVHVGP